MSTWSPSFDRSRNALSSPAKPPPRTTTRGFPLLVMLAGLLRGSDASSSTRSAQLGIGRDADHHCGKAAVRSRFPRPLTSAVVGCVMHQEGGASAPPDAVREVREKGAH